MPVASPLVTYCIATLGVFASGCLPHLSFGAIGPLGPYDAKYTLELQLHPHCLSLQLLVQDGLGVQILANQELRQLRNSLNLVRKFIFIVRSKLDFYLSVFSELIFS